MADIAARCIRCQGRRGRVACNAERPRCGYCARRNFECGYRDPPAQQGNGDGQVDQQGGQQDDQQGGGQGGVPIPPPAQPQQAPVNHPAQPLAHPPAQPAAQQLGAINAISEQVVNQLLDAEAFQDVIMARVEATIAARDQQRAEQERHRADQDRRRAANATNGGAQEVAEVGADPRAGAVPRAVKAAAADAAAAIATVPEGETIHPTAIAAGHRVTLVHLRARYLRTDLVPTATTAGIGATTTT
ncbi:hypothetical protein FRC07_004942, partial [Ceratobasidium sp. 392]